MLYTSTQNNKESVSSAQAIAQGISVEGGLFVPYTFPSFTKEDFMKLSQLDYKARAKFILKNFLNDFTDDETDACVEGAYTGSFDNEQPAPISLIGENANVLDTNNMPIEGLYAAGDMTAGSIYGDTPANAGGTVYGSMTIGFVAGESAAAFVKGEN